jgi:hypothetical protein
LGQATGAAGAAHHPLTVLAKEGLQKVTRSGFLNTLSGRFLILTVIFVMLAEILIFVPSIARFRADFMLTRLKQAQIAALTQLATEDMITPALEAELLANAEVFNVVLRRDEVRQLVLSSPVPGAIHATYDLRLAGPWELIRDAFSGLVDPENRIIRVIGAPVQDAGTLIEVTMETKALREAIVGADLGRDGLPLVSRGAAAFGRADPAGGATYADLCRGPRGRPPRH